MEIEQFDEERVREWETGLPNAIDLTPLSHHLLSPELASAFSITAEPFQTMLDVNRASQNTLSSLRRHNSGFSSNNFKSLSSFMENRCVDSDPDPDPVPIPIVVDEDEPEPEPDLREKRKILEEADSEMRMDNFNEDCSAKTLKRARLVWTPQLHKRFVDVVAHLGIDSAVPKTIMQLMNVEGLTRENVASHLQKYRLYLKRMNEGATTPNDQLFSSAPVPPSLREGTGNRHKTVVPAPPPPPPLVAATHVASVLPAPSHASGGHMRMPGGNAASGGAQYNPYGMFRENQGHWSGNNFGSVVPHSHVSPNDQ